MTSRGRRIEVYPDGAGEWRWRRFAGNGEEIGRSEEGYVHRAYAVDVARERNPDVDLLIVLDE